LYDETKIPQVANTLDTFERDCAVTVALKITDDTCKMDDYEKSIFMMLYDAIDDKKSTYFDKNVFDIIQEGRKTPSAQIYATIKILRQNAMEMITQPRMKAFKAGVRKKIANDTI
jgi:NADPH-dependent ferric siderophore reductase